MDAAQSSKSYTPPDGASILEQINPAREVNDLMLSFLGLQLKQTKKAGVTSYEFVRDNKPTFTDEYVRDLIKDIKQFVNFTTQVSRYDEKRIQKHVGKYLLALKSSLCTQGDDHFISDRTWQRIMEIYNSTYEETILTDEGKEQVVSRNGWRRFGIVWEYDQPVRFEMLQFGIKDFDEEIDQAFNFRRVIQALAPFLEGSLNKSFAGKLNNMGMLLSALGEMRTETQTYSGADKKRRGSLFGGGSDDETSQTWG